MSPSWGLDLEQDLELDLDLDIFLFCFVKLVYEMWLYNSHLNYMIFED